MWERRVIEFLAACKACGLPWWDASHQARCRFPPLGRRWRGNGEESVEEFFWRVCEAAYTDAGGEPGSGNGPAIAAWRPELAAEMTWLEVDRRAA